VTNRRTGIELRPLSNDDIPALAGHLAAVEAVDRTGEHYNESDLVEEFGNPELERGKDIVGAFDGDDLVGYFLVYPRSAADTYQRVHLEGSVRPQRRGQGIGTRLVEAMVARADAVHRERHPDRHARFTLSGSSANEEQAQLLAAFGIVPDRWSFTMRAQVRAVDPPADLPDGLEIRRYDASYDAAMLAAHNEAFADHPNFAPWTRAMWRHWVTDSRSFRADLSLVVVESARPERVVSYLQSNEYDATFEVTGRREAYVAKVGTLPEFRSRGLATTLLRQALALYRDAGYDEAALDVDSENPTGALGVYRRAGFEVESRWTNYALVREPVAPGPAG
jgi:mycothiol synthase